MEKDLTDEVNTDIPEFIEHIVLKRIKALDNAIFGEIEKIAIDNELFTTIKLNEKAIVEAFKKATPTMPYTRDLWELGTAEGYSCPTCGYDFPVSYFELYCCKCGQAIKYKDHPTEKGGSSDA